MFRYLIVSLALFSSMLFTTKPASAQYTVITQVNSIPLPSLGGTDLSGVTFPSQGGWNLNNNVLFTRPGIASSSRTGANIVLTGNQQIWGVIRPPTSPNEWDSCFSVVNLHWVYAGSTRHGVGVWNHCNETPGPGFIWFKLLSDFTNLGYTTGTGASQGYRVKIFLSQGNVWNVHFWHFPSNSWQAVFSDWNGEIGDGPSWPGQVKNGYSWKTQDGCPSIGQYLRFSDVQVQTSNNVWTNGGPNRVTQATGCFPSSYTISESTVSPSWVQTNH